MWGAERLGWRGHVIQVPGECSWQWGPSGSGTASWRHVPPT